MAESAICLGVIGTWLDLETVSPAPVTAQVMKTSRFIARGMRLTTSVASPGAVQMNWPLPSALSPRMSKNRGVVYLRPGKVEVRDIDDPKLEAPDGRRIEHGVILKVISTNICGSDQHMVRGRTTAMPGLVLGHEITGEIIEKGIDVEMLDVGDIVSVPFNVACGRCRCCKSQDTGVCLTVNPARAGGAYGYVDMGGWIGGQARYVTIPYADFNLLKIPDRDKAMAKIRDLTMLSDILPTGFHGAVRAGVGVGSTVYVAGAGPVGLAAAASARILGAAVVMIGDFNKDRLAHAARVGFEPIDLSKSDRLGDMPQPSDALRHRPHQDRSIVRLAARHKSQRRSDHRRHRRAQPQPRYFDDGGRG